MTRLGGFGVPGSGALVETTEAELLWGSDLGRLIAIRKSAVISGATRDSGNTPTTVLRPGLVLGKETASGEYSDYDPDATDGSQVAEAILATELRAQDFDANNADRVFGVIVGGLIKGGKLHGLDAQARKQLQASGRFIFDDDLFAKHSHLGSPYTNQQVTGDLTLTKADSGKRLICTTGDSDITLPELSEAGMVFQVLRASDHELAVISSEGDNMIVGNDLSADRITFTTAGEQVGAMVHVESIYVGTTLKWLTWLPIPAFGTGLTGGFTYAIVTA